MRLYFTYLAMTAFIVTDEVRVQKEAKTVVPSIPYFVHNHVRRGHQIPGRNEPKKRKGYSVLRIHARTEVQRHWLVALQNDPQLDFWTPPDVMEVTDVMVSPVRRDTFITELKAEHFEWSVLIPDVQDAVDSEHAHPKLSLRSKTHEGFSFNRYLRYAEIIRYLKYLAGRYPEVAHVQSLGNSIEGRHIPVFIISRGGFELRPLVFVEACIHGNEWITTAMALYIIQQLLENENNEDLSSGLDWLIMPLVNPDGYEFSHVNDRFWRGNRGGSECIDSNMTHGVDLNRNFDYHWIKEAEEESLKCGKHFNGHEAFSEPESRAIRDVVNANQKRSAIYLSLHSYGRHILYPWFYANRTPDNWVNLEKLAQRANKAQWKVSGVSYTVGPAGRKYSSIPGTSTDWARGVGKVPIIYTVFLPGGGNVSFDPPASSIRGVVTSFFPAVRVLARHITTPLYDDFEYAQQLKPAWLGTLLCCVAVALVCS